MNNSQLIYKIVSLIPKGKVLTYGALAKLVGMKNPRVVGSILHKNPDPKNIPCHKVVNHKGKVAKNYAFGGGEIQREKLEKEGVEFEKGRVDLKKYLWKTPWTPSPIWRRNNARRNRNN